MERFSRPEAIAVAVMVLVIGACAAGAAPVPAAPSRPQVIVFPDDAGVVDVTRPPYGAKGDGTTDDTAAIQRALDDHPNQGAIIYLPHGTYLISDTLKWPHGSRGGSEEKNTILQGQSAAGTTVRLADGCAGYGDAARPKAMVWTGRKPAQRFRNAIRNLTFDTGRGNPGTAAVQFMANNQGGMWDVVIRSGDGQGAIGLDMGYSDEIGPCLVKHVTVVGFDVGIRTLYGVDSMVFEHVTLRDQRQYGFYNDGQCVTVRGLATSGPATAVYNGGGSSFMVLIDSHLEGTGAAARKTAIVNLGAILVRSVRTSGYAAAMESRGTTQPGPDLAEFCSHPVLSLFPSPQRTLGLEIRETPEVPWDDPKDWASPTHFGAVPGDKEDDSPAIQKAIDSGKPTVYFPRGTFHVKDTVLVRGSVRRIIGCEAHVEAAPMEGKPAFRIIDGAAPVVVFERLRAGYARTTYIEHAAARTLVMRSLCNINCHATGTGDLFIEDVCSNPFTDWRFKGQKVWARQFNVENEGTHVVNEGGTLWILGLKTERGGTLIDTRDGGRTELLGGFCYTTTDPRGAPMFALRDSAATFSLGEACFKGCPYETLVSETRGSQNRMLKKGEAPGRSGGSLIPLFVGYPAPK